MARTVRMIMILLYRAGGETCRGEIPMIQISSLFLSDFSQQEVPRTNIAIMNISAGETVRFLGCLHSRFWQAAINLTEEPMADIKTKDVRKGSIKTIDKAAVASQRMKRTYIATKEKAEHSTHASENSAEEYAADRIESAADTAVHEGANQADKVGR